MPDGTIPLPADETRSNPSGINGQGVYAGTAGVDRIWGGADNDTFWGFGGDDVIEGDDGATLRSAARATTSSPTTPVTTCPRAGRATTPSTPAPAPTLWMGGDGKDFTNGGANVNETFAGEGDDFVIAGQGEDAVFGDSGDDWDGGRRPARTCSRATSGNLFFLDDSINKPGSDVLIGQGGDDDYDMEGGDDIGVGGPGIEKVAGASGFDWEIGMNDPQAQNQDLDLPLVGVDILTNDVRDRFNEVEALSGWDHDDVLRGDDVVPADGRRCRLHRQRRAHRRLA